MDVPIHKNGLLYCTGRCTPTGKRERENKACMVYLCWDCTIIKTCACRIDFVGLFISITIFEKYFLHKHHFIQNLQFSVISSLEHNLSSIFPDGRYEIFIWGEYCRTFSICLDTEVYKCLVPKSVFYMVTWVKNNKLCNRNLNDYHEFLNI